MTINNISYIAQDPSRFISHAWFGYLMNRESDTRSKLLHVVITSKLYDNSIHIFSVSSISL